ncbi:MAG TPA: hypothetical protein PK867_17355 [Pirellulales bacterium]|nr:hypothetical protein [Pirellulales bacterium]
MVFEGHVENGGVVFQNPLPLPDGTPVRVESLAVPGFWESPSIDDLARQQGVPALSTLEELLGGWCASMTSRQSSWPALSTLEELLGGWPADEADDDLESCVHAWRQQEMDNRP